jgi:hypothetical protein
MQKKRVLKQEEMENFEYVKSNTWKEECVFPRCEKFYVPKSPFLLSGGKRP